MYSEFPFCLADPRKKQCRVPNCKQWVVRMWNHLYQGKKHANQPPSKKAMYLHPSNEEEKANTSVPSSVVMVGGEGEEGEQAAADIPANP